MLSRGKLLVNKALDMSTEDNNEDITAQGNEEPSRAQPLEKLSSPLSNNLTSPDRLEEYSSPILDLLANLSPFKSPDYISGSSEYGDDIIVAGGKKMRLPNGKSRRTIIEESTSEGENTAKSPVFIPCSDDDTVSINDKVPKKGRPKKGRKFKYGGLSRMERKKNRHSNKPFHNYKNIEVQPKVFIDYKCNCKTKCWEKIDSNNRHKIFETFYKLENYNTQNMYIAASVKEADVKRRMTNSNMKKKFSRKYLLDKVEVCRNLYVKTLGVSTKRVNTALAKLRSQDCLDRRGSKSGGWNKCSDELVSQVICHINSLPKYKSHYRRREAEKVSKAMYTKLFYTNFNLKRAPLKKDTCNKCDTLQAKLTHCKTTEEKTAIDTEREEHCRKWEQARHVMKTDFILATQCKELECLTFDLQKTLPMPKIPTGIIYYKRQLWLYNMGIYSAKTNTSGCFVWIEGMAGKGAQEVGSCLLKYLGEHISEDVEELILWSDSCGGQNRNIKLILMLKAFLHCHPTLKKITQKFLISGHSYLPNDRDFSHIESAIKKYPRLYTPDDYIQVIKDCKKKNPLKVTLMAKSDFLGTSKVEKMIINRKRGINKECINWLQTREIYIERDSPNSIYFKTDFFGNSVEVNVGRAPVRGRPGLILMEHLVPLWPSGKPVSPAKLADIQSILHLIPQDAQSFYHGLNCDNTIEDDIDGLDTVDFEIQFDDNVE
ncbi:unnamed protein product [Danaus chrysippus]|uniref:(African queen) hypothetical protein n=1 Tax=Danaus chrysippus TaxID=151541 RepID=A0A8J2QYJ2_9NEOP|nr:unnamed protein product [Danaus chrysippus]